MSEDTLSRVKYQNYLLVEGSDDKHVFYHLLDYHHIRQLFKDKGESFEIIDHEGIDNLLSVKTLGTILKEEESPIVGIWLMPDNKIAGMIEHFISLLRPENDVLWPIAENIVQKVVDTDCRFPSTQMAKAYIHTWLAWQKEPGKPMGQAITARYLDADASHALKLITCIRGLFDLESA